MSTRSSISTGQSRDHDASKNNLIENERTKNSGCENECPPIAASAGFNAQASEPLVGERSHQINLSGERTIYEGRFYYRAKLGVEENVAQGSGVRDENVELLHQPGRA